MKVQGLILGLLLPCVALAQLQYYGTRVSTLTLEGVGSQTDLDLVPIRPGDTLTVENVRSSIQALYDTGRYRHVEVEATRDGDRTSLVFRVQPNSFFSTFRLVPEDVLERPLSSYIRLPFGEKFNTTRLDEIAQQTTDLLNTEGYFQATVDPSYRVDDETHLVVVTLQAMPGPKARFGTIQVHGGEETFPNMELLHAVKLKMGDTFSSSKLDKAISSIRSKFTELNFLNTRIDPKRSYSSVTNTVDIDINVQPGVFALVETRGFNIPAKKLKELVPIFEEGTYDKDLVDEGGEAIIRYLQEQGYFDASLTSEIIEVKPPLGNAVQINYMISPGRRHETATLKIEGNQYFSTDKIKEQIKTRTGQFLNKGVFSSDILESDRQSIEAMYRNAGFEGTKVTTHTVEVDHAINVTIQIEEGNRQRIVSISIAGNSAFSTKQLRDVLPFKEGDEYTPAKVDQGQAAITQIYHARGYADVRVGRMVEPVTSPDGLSVSFEITEGQTYQLGSIVVAGNTLTSEKLIRRNSGLQSYKPYDPEAVLEAQQKLYATGLFSRVEIVPLDQGISGVRNVLIQVEDAKPILLTYGVGYQEFEHARGTFEITHNNLFGMNRSLGLRTRASSRERLAQLTYTEPHLFNHNIDGFVSSFVEHTDMPSYTANRIDFSLQTLKRFALQRNLLFTAGYQTVDLQDIRVNIHALSLPAERGIIQIARVGTTYVQDHRNDPANPTTGTFNTTTFQVAFRPLGSEINFTSLYDQYNVYKPIRGGVLATSVRIGWNRPFGSTTNAQIPPTERYFAGGSTTLRGFGFDDVLTSGGNFMTLGNLEYRFPLRFFPIKGVGGAVFYDTGNVFPVISNFSLTNFSHTVGYGFRYQTPLGPVRIDFGFNLRPNVNQDNTAIVHVFFTLGNPF
jgi:outer membrane protein assembly complex protein YaeT